MKRLLFLLLLLPLITMAQFHTSLGVGADMQKSHGIAAWDIGYDIFGINLDAEIKPSLTRNVDVNNYMGVKLGYNIGNEGFKIIPSIGYYYNLVSADKRTYNKYYPGYSIRGVYMVKPDAGLFWDVMEIHKSWEGLMGIYIQFN